MRWLFFFLLVWLWSIDYGWAQDLSGTWEGRIDVEFMRLVLIKQGNTYIGYTYDEGAGFCKTNFLGNFNDADRLLKGAGQSYIARTLNHVMCSYKLTFSEQSDGKYLIGTANAKSALTQIFSMGVPVRTVLKQVSTHADTTDYMFTWLLKNGNQNNTVVQHPKMDTPTAVATSPGLSSDERNQKAFNDSITAVKMQRMSDTLSTILTAADSIVISIADNEVVDGDTVTVFHNNEVLVSKLFVSNHPYKIVVPLSHQVPVHEFVLVANNLGSIPPNTALLTIEAGKDRFQLKAASDLKKNAVIIFKRRK